MRASHISFFPVGGVRGREKYVWTLWPAFLATKVIARNGCKLRTWYAIKTFIWLGVTVHVLCSLGPH